MRSYESRDTPLLPWPKFRRRMARHAGHAAELLGASLLLGTLGFHFLAGQTWIDALLNSAMLLGGMGPVGDIKSTLGKLFASGYALYAGLVFLATATILMAPLFHRFIHKFHLQDAGKAAGGSEPDP